MTLGGGWLGAMWPFVGDHLPPAPASVLEVGCGSAGGFVPALRREGYDAVGVDPHAPDEAGFHRTEFERYEPPQRVAAVVASNSLHHVESVDEAVGRICDALLPDGVVVVVEWAWERFDEATARWCFSRLADVGDHNWLRRRHEDWAASGRPWDAYFPAWATNHNLHASRDVVHALDVRFIRRVYAEGPYLFPDLSGVACEDEQAAIDAGQIRATGIRYVGTPRASDEAGNRWREGPKRDVETGASKNAAMPPG
jgi:SAM-dependent methyltransferase